MFKWIFGERPVAPVYYEVLKPQLKPDDKAYPYFFLLRNKYMKLNAMWNSIGQVSEIEKPLEKCSQLKQEIDVLEYGIFRSGWACDQIEMRQIINNMWIPERNAVKDFLNKEAL